MNRQCLICKTTIGLETLTLQSTNGLHQVHDLCLKHLERWCHEAGVSLGRMAREWADVTGPVVHVLHEGRALCGMPGLFPKDWPDGHKWVRLDEAKDATCVACKGLSRNAWKGAW